PAPGARPHPEGRARATGRPRTAARSAPRPPRDGAPRRGWGAAAGVPRPCSGPLDRLEAVAPALVGPERRRQVAAPLVAGPLPGPVLARRVGLPHLDRGPGQRGRAVLGVHRPRHG